MQNAVAAAVPEGKGITGSTLKMVAIISMFIDHTAAIVLERALWENGFSSETMMIAYQVMRSIGRLGFPIFCFLVIEGFSHTSNVKKYAGRMFLFALVSEIPFDLGFVGEAFYWQYQNVFFTLLIGLLVLIGFRFVEEKAEWNRIVRIVLTALMLAAGMYIAELFMTDYGSMGVLTIVVMYVFRKNRVLEAAAGCAVLIWMSYSELPAFLILPLVQGYNGKRGWNLKWIFYIFYPAHIFLLYLIAYAVGLRNMLPR